MNPGDIHTQPDNGPAEPAPAGATGGSGRSVGRTLSGLAGHRRLAGVAALLAVAGLIGGAYAVGGPHTSSASAATFNGLDAGAAQAQTRELTPGATPASAVDTTGKTASLGSSGQGGAGGSLLDTMTTTLIVKTGQLSLEVADVDKAVAGAQSIVAGLGGYVSGSNRSGSDADLVESVTYRLPASRWDDALAAMRKLGARTLSEQTDSTDVTSQAIDLQARIDNLKATEAALQAIMARATVIADVIAVETQLSDVQGQIEELTAQSNHLKDQASLSTLTVTFQLPGLTVTSQATSDWTLGSQVDQAVAALVRIGQGLATIGVWALIVVLPALLGLLAVLSVVALLRRIARRRRPQTGGVAQA